MDLLKKTHKLYGQVISCSEILKYDSCCEFYVKFFLFSSLESPVGERQPLVIILVRNGDAIFDARAKFTPSSNYVIDNVEIISQKAKGVPVVTVTSHSSIVEVQSQVQSKHLNQLKRNLQQHTYTLTVNEVTDEQFGIYRLECDWTLITSFHHVTPILSAGDVVAVTFPHVLLTVTGKVLICCQQSTLHITNNCRAYSSHVPSTSLSLRAALSHSFCCLSLVQWLQRVEEGMSEGMHWQPLRGEETKEAVVMSLFHQVLAREAPQWGETVPRPLDHFSALGDHLCNYKPPIEITTEVLSLVELMSRHQSNVQSQTDRNVSKDLMWWSVTTQSSGAILGTATLQHTGVIGLKFAENTENVVLHISRGVPKVLTGVEDGDLLWIFNATMVTEYFNIRTHDKRRQLTNKSYLTVESKDVIPVKKKELDEVEEDSYVKISVVHKYNIVLENSSSWCKSDLFFVCWCIVTSCKTFNGITTNKSENCLLRFKGADLMKIYPRLYEGCDLVIKERGRRLFNPLKNCSWVTQLVNNQKVKVVFYDFISSVNIHSISESEDVSTLMKYRTASYESLSEILKPDVKCGVALSIVAIIASRYHQESLFKSEKTNLSEAQTDLDVGFPGGKLIRLLLEDVRDKSSCCLYIPLKSGTLMTKHPYALLPGCVIRFTRVVKYSSKNSGKIYLKSTSFSTFNVLKYPTPLVHKEKMSANTAAVMDSSSQGEVQNGTESNNAKVAEIENSALTAITLQEACKECYLGQTFKTFASVLRLHKLLIRLKCSCGTEIQSSHCPNPCCSSNLPPTLDIYAKLTLTCDERQITVILKEIGVLLKVLDLSLKMWEKMTSLLIANRMDVKYVPLQNGGLMDFKALDNMGEREGMVKETILLYLHEVCSCKEYMRYSTYVLKRFWKDGENKAPLFFCVDILDNEKKGESVC